MPTTDAVLPLTLLASASGARTWAGVAALEPRTVIPAFAAAVVEDVTVITTAAAGALLMRRPSW